MIDWPVILKRFFLGTCRGRHNLGPTSSMHSCVSCQRFFVVEEKLLFFMGLETKEIPDDAASPFGCYIVARSERPGGAANSVLLHGANLDLNGLHDEYDIPSPPSSLSSAPSSPIAPCKAGLTKPSVLPDTNLCPSVPSPSSTPAEEPLSGKSLQQQRQGEQTQTSLQPSLVDAPIVEWLRPLGLQKYAAGLLLAGFRSVKDLHAKPPTDATLRGSCGIAAMGARRKLLSALSSLEISTKTVADSRRKLGEQISVTKEEPTSLVTEKPKRKLWAIFEPGYHVTSPSKRPRSARIQAAQKKKEEQRQERPRGRRHSLAKRVNGTSFTVDSFHAALSDPGCTTFFLSHFHADHYGGLRKRNLPAGARVYCSSVTSRLVKALLSIPEAFIRTFPIGRKFDVPDTGRGPNAGASIWAFDANHCPGAVVLLFYVWSTKRYILHCGDCRFDPRVFDRHEKLSQVVRAGHLDYLHLDTTYCNPKYVFPHQETVLNQVVEIARQEDRRTRGRCLFFFGTYSIGKEKVFLAVANELKLKIYTGKRKRSILNMLDLGPRFTDRVVDSPREARVHVISMRELSPDGLSGYARRNGLNRDFVGRGLAIVLRPTGWSFNGSSETPRGKSRADDQAIFYNIPYSEHSSFEELHAFVSWSNAARIIPTVNARSKQAVEEMCTALGHKDRSLRSTDQSEREV